MHALCEGRLVRIQQPELLEHIFLLTEDITTQGMLLCTSKAWAAACKSCVPLTVSVGLRHANSSPLRSGWAAGGKTPLPPGGLPAAAAWLAQQHGLVPRLGLRLDPSSFPGRLGRGEAGPSPLPDTATLQAQAAAVVAATPGLRSLDVWSEVDVQWLPRLAVLTSLSLDFTWKPDEYSGAHGPLDCISHVAPRLRSLVLGTHLAEDLYLSPAATLPPSLTRMHINGLVEGLGPHLPQVEQLGWHPRERRTDFRLPMDAIDGLRLASRLTSLSLTAPSPANIPAFFDSLACLTGLRSLSIGYYGDAEAYEYVLGELIPEALGEMTSLTDLSLAVHDMPVCPYTLSRLPQLRCLDLCLNEGLRQLPHGPWPALERLNVDSELIDAALDDPPAQPADAAVAEAAPPAASGHALWSMHHLTHLSIMWDWEEEENEEKKQAIRRLLPQLQRID